MKNRRFPCTPIIDTPDEAARLAAWVQFRRQALDLVRQVAAKAEDGAYRVHEENDCNLELDAQTQH